MKAFLRNGMFHWIGPAAPKGRAGAATGSMS